MSNLLQRIISSIVLLPLVIYIIYVGGNLYTALIVFVWLVIIYEWVNITKIHEKNGGNKKWVIVGVLYTAIPCLSLLYLRSITNLDPLTNCILPEICSEAIVGRNLIFHIFLIVVFTDVGAYFFGRLIGGPKIAPKISPNKTWAGLFGGMICAAIASGIFVYSIESNIVLHMALAALLAVIAQVGDFFESWVKRKFGVKDSGNIIPGHGGLLDRVDGLLSVAVAALILIIIRAA